MRSEFKLGQWLVDADSGEVRRGTRVRHLEPQVMRVLRFLADNAGTVVSRRTLKAELWRGSIVEDAAVTRCVSQIRKALGDDPKNPRYLETIPKVGFRLIARVGEPGWSIGKTAGVAAASAAVALVLVAVVFLWQRPAPATLDIAAIQTQSVAEGAGAIAQLLHEDVADPLGQIFDDGDVLHESGRSYCLNAALIDAPSGLTYRASLTLAGTGEQTWQQDYAAVDGNFFSVRERIVTDVANRLGQGVPDDLSRRLARAPTHSLEAYRLYRQAKRLYVRYRRALNERALVLFRQAVELDPEFALAHAGVAEAISQQIMRWHGGDADAALAAARRGVELDPEHTETHTALGTALKLTGDIEGALSSLQRAVELDADNWRAAYNAAGFLKHETRYQEARNMYLLALRTEPAFPSSLVGLGIVDLHLGDVESATRWLDRALIVSPLAPDAVAHRAMVDMLNGRFDVVAGQCEPVLASIGEDYDCLRLIAASSLAAGDTATASEHLQRIARFRPDDRYSKLGMAQVLIARGEESAADAIIAELIAGSTDDIVSGIADHSDYWIAAAAHALRGETEAALNHLDRAADSGWRFHRWDAVEPAFSGIRGAPRFAAYLERQQPAR